MHTLTKSELIHANCLVPNTIYEGMDNYSHHMIEGNSTELTNYLNEKVKENGEANTYFDFYYGTLPDEAKEKANTVLTKEEVTSLNCLQLSTDPAKLFYVYDSILFPIAVKLSVTEMLFSTFYFAKTKETVWSNYDGKFVVFAKKS